MPLIIVIVCMQESTDLLHDEYSNHELKPFLTDNLGTKPMDYN